jgi:hypothetical protein
MAKRFKSVSNIYIKAAPGGGRSMASRCSSESDRFSATEGIGRFWTWLLGNLGLDCKAAEALEAAFPLQTIGEVLQLSQDEEQWRTFVGKLQEALVPLLCDDMDASYLGAALEEAADDFLTLACLAAAQDTRSDALPPVCPAQSLHSCAQPPSKRQRLLEFAGVRASTVAGGAKTADACSAKAVDGEGGMEEAEETTHSPWMQKKLGSVQHFVAAVNPHIPQSVLIVVAPRSDADTW